MILCNHCHASLPDIAKFCPDCGQNLTAQFDARAVRSNAGKTPIQPLLAYNNAHQPTLDSPTVPSNPPTIPIQIVSSKIPSNPPTIPMQIVSSKIPSNPPTIPMQIVSPTVPSNPPKIPTQPLLDYQDNVK